MVGDIADDQIDDMMQQEAARGTGADIDPERDMQPSDEIACPDCPWRGTLEDCQMSQTTHYGRWIEYMHCPRCMAIL